MIQYCLIIVVFFFSTISFIQGSDSLKDIPIDSLLPTNHLLTNECPKLLHYIQQKQHHCLTTYPTETAYLCFTFSADVEFLITFLFHHLMIGFQHIFIYNNDESLAWYYHPTIICLLSEDLITIQPWPGQRIGVQSYDHCTMRIREFSQIIEFQPKNVSILPLDHVWMAAFDVDEYLVLHQDDCVNQFIGRYSEKAPGIALNWAMFIPTYPYSKEIITSVNQSHPMITFPQEMITTRLYENRHIKTIARLNCINNWPSPHHPDYFPRCPQGREPIDPQGKLLKNVYYTPYVDNIYPIAQLSHYWITSIRQFLRKIHRGYGPDTARDNPNYYRSTIEFLTNVKKITNDNTYKKISDTSFITRYGKRFEDLKKICLSCFNVSYFYPQFYH